MIDHNSKIYIAGHNGMVGSACWRLLEYNGYKNLLGYKPGYSIDNGYNAYIEWYKDFFHKSK